MIRQRLVWLILLLVVLGPARLAAGEGDPPSRTVSWLAMPCQADGDCPLDYSCQPSPAAFDDEPCACPACGRSEGCPTCACPDCSDGESFCAAEAPAKMCRYDGFGCTADRDCPSGFLCVAKVEGCGTGTVTSGSVCLQPDVCGGEEQSVTVYEDDECEVLWTYCYPAAADCAGDGDCPSEWSCEDGSCEPRGWPELVGVVAVGSDELRLYEELVPGGVASAAGDAGCTAGGSASTGASLGGLLTLLFLIVAWRRLPDRTRVASKSRCPKYSIF